MPSNNNNKNNQSSSSSSSSSSSFARGQSANNPAAAAGDKSNYKMTKEGWGDRVSFQHSMGLNMTPNDIHEGNEILDAFRRSDPEQQAAQRK
ncbi:hypothetical protein VP1G_08092 [Cytospora mali]|uniref:Uncharacterized protein n=1 Tax=Cytospora mali TaxID=578113 RepID=A0A194VA48_CYTMA|nr:hypothetical protein VP1G_08092 [Valsa mali var. pyri (nom. inval.)]